MLKGLECKSAHQIFWTTVQNVKIIGVSCIHACIKLCAVRVKRGRVERVCSRRVAMVG